MGRVICVFVCVLPVLILMSDGVTAAEIAEPPNFAVSGSAFLRKYCLKCHNDQERSAELSLQGLTDNAALVRRRQAVTRILRVASC